MAGTLKIFSDAALNWINVVSYVIHRTTRLFLMLLHKNTQISHSVTTMLVGLNVRLAISSRVAISLQLVLLAQINKLVLHFWGPSHFMHSQHSSHHRTIQQNKQSHNRTFVDFVRMGWIRPKICLSAFHMASNVILFIEYDIKRWVTRCIKKIEAITAEQRPRCDISPSQCYTFPL